MAGLGDDLDLPFESSPHGQFDAGDAQFSGGVVVMASTIEIHDLGIQPALIFRFARPDGDFYPPIVLVARDDQLAKLRPLVNGAIHAAREAAKRSHR